MPPLAVEITFGTGRYAAADTTDPQRPEWPPHLMRLYAALVEAWAQSGSDPPDPAERAALEWLERLPPPSVWEPGGTPRLAVNLYVPANNATPPSKEDRKRGVTQWWSLLPSERHRPPRLSVPSTLVDGDGPVVFAWPGTDPPIRHRFALAALLRRVTRMGHSTSFVACRLIAESPDPVWVPQHGSEGADFAMRGTYRGMLADLRARYRTYQETGLRKLPVRTSTVFYRNPRILLAPPTPPAARDADGEWLTFQVVGYHRLPTTCTAHVATALRGSLLSHGPAPGPRLLLGKDTDGRPLKGPYAHALCLALPAAGRRYSDGTIRAVVVMLPPDPDTAERLAVLKAVAAWEQSRHGKPLELRLGRLGELALRRLPRANSGAGWPIDRSIWTGPSRRWGSVTPLALPRERYRLGRGPMPDRRRAWRQAEQAVAEAITWAGLPEPIAVDVGYDPPVRGGAHTANYPTFVQNTERLLLHATIEFARSVAGPVVLGSGRFRGLGLMLPLDRPTPDRAAKP